MLQELLKRRRSDETQDADSRDSVALTLGNLGALYSETHRFAEAEAAFSDAANIRRQLAAQDAASFRPALVQLLHNMSTFFLESYRLNPAEAACKDAIAVERELVAQNPNMYRAELASTLNSLGLIYEDMPRLAEADVALREAVFIFSDLAVQSPSLYRPSLAQVLMTRHTLSRSWAVSATLRSYSGITLSIFARPLSAQSPAPLNRCSRSLKPTPVCTARCTAIAMLAIDAEVAALHTTGGTITTDDPDKSARAAKRGAAYRRCSRKT